MELFTTNGLQPIDPEALVAQVDALNFSSRPPFDPTSLTALGDLSNRLLRTPLAAQAPQLVALGFWLRPANSLWRLSALPPSCPTGRVPRHAYCAAPASAECRYAFRIFLGAVFTCRECEHYTPA